MAGMPTLVTLFVLTAMPAEAPFEGGMSTAYTIKESRDVCEASIESVNEILAAGGVKVVTIECLTMGQPITQFQHRPPKDAPRHAFLNRIKDGKLMLIPQQSEKACQATYTQQDKDGIRQYCSTSKQNLAKL